MGIGLQHFENLELPGKNIRSLDLLGALHPEIRAILEEELNRGNKIFAVTQDYPEQGSISVSLRYPFKQAYNKPGLTFFQGETPHDIGQSYTVGKPAHQICSK